MLAIRLQRTGRRGHAQFRVIVQDDRFNPSSGRVVAYVGSYDPHTKATTLDSEKIGGYLANGAQPSSRVARLLKNEGIKLPKWVTISESQKRETKNPEKLRRNRPAEDKKGESAEAPQEETAPTEAEEIAVDDAQPKEEESPTQQDDSAPATELEAESDSKSA